MLVKLVNDPPSKIVISRSKKPSQEINVRIENSTRTFNLSMDVFVFPSSLFSYLYQRPHTDIVLQLSLMKKLFIPYFIICFRMPFLPEVQRFLAKKFLTLFFHRTFIDCYLENFE